ncbi:unnamed protein product [Arctogadus glacialis]
MERNRGNKHHTVMPSSPTANSSDQRPVLEALSRLSRFCSREADEQGTDVDSEKPSFVVKTRNSISSDVEQHVAAGKEPPSQSHWSGTTSPEPLVRNNQPRATGRLKVEQAELVEQAGLDERGLEPHLSDPHSRTSGPVPGQKERGPIDSEGRGRQLCGGLLHRHKANRFSVYTSSNRGGMFQNSAWFREKHLQFQGLMSWTSLLVLVTRVPDPQPDV